MIDNLISTLKQAISLFIFTLLIGAGAVYAIAFIQYGFLVESLDFMVEYYHHYQNYLTTAILIGYLALFSIIINQQKRMANKEHCNINTVTLAELSKIWLPAERQEEEIRAKIAEEVNDEMEMRALILESTYFEKRATWDFFNMYVKSNLKFINLKELVVIRDLLIILEKEGGIPSVVSFYDKDPETTKMQNERRGEYTAFQIHAQFSLYDHSIRVAKKVMQQLENADKEFNLGWQFRIGKGLVVALGHDIGKIESIEHLNISQPENIRKMKSHAALSQLMFLDAFYDYEDAQELSELILNHHTPRKDQDRLGELLVKAEKIARTEEMSLWSDRSAQKYKDLYSSDLGGAVEQVGRDRNENSQDGNRESYAPSFDVDEAKKQRMSSPIIEQKVDEAVFEEKHIEGNQPSADIGNVQKEDRPAVSDVGVCKPVESESVVEVAESQKPIVAPKKTKPRNRQKEQPSLPAIEQDEVMSSDQTQSLLMDLFNVPKKTEMKKSEHPAPPSTQTALSAPTRDEVSRADPADFDFASIDTLFKEEVLRCLNQWEESGANPACVSYGEKILIGSGTMTRIIRELLHLDDHEDFAAYIKKILIDMRKNGYMDKNSGDYSVYSILRNEGKPKKYTCIELHGSYIGMSREELQQNLAFSAVSEINIEPFRKK